MPLYYVRHGETVWNRAQRLQGRSDSALTTEGLELARRYGRALRARLPDPSVVAVCSSPLGRALATAREIVQALGLPPSVIRTDELLIEQNVGRFEGMSWPEIEREYGVTRQAFFDPDYRPPGGESRREVLERALGWLARPRRGATVLVSHGAFSRIFRGAYLGLQLHEQESLCSHTHGRFFRLQNRQVEELLVDVPAPARIAQ